MRADPPAQRPGQPKVKGNGGGRGRSRQSAWLWCENCNDNWIYSYRVTADGKNACCNKCEKPWPQGSAAKSNAHSPGTSDNGSGPKNAELDDKALAYLHVLLAPDAAAASSSAAAKEQGANEEIRNQVLQYVVAKLPPKKEPEQPPTEGELIRKSQAKVRTATNALLTAESSQRRQDAKVAELAKSLREARETAATLAAETAKARADHEKAIKEHVANNGVVPSEDVAGPTPLPAEWEELRKEEGGGGLTVDEWAALTSLQERLQTKIRERAKKKRAAADMATNTRVPEDPELLADATEEAARAADEVKQAAAKKQKAEEEAAAGDDAAKRNL